MCNLPDHSRGIRNPKGDFGASCFAWAFRRRFIYAGGRHLFLLQAHGRRLFTVIFLFAVARGSLHYGEQYCNHYIAFRILAIIRHKVFAILRNSVPAKLEGKEKGNLISVITSDIELLEVFFAHTVSPIAIAFLTSLIMLIFIGKQHILAGGIAFFAYLTAACYLPVERKRRREKPDGA